jgi:hypothetical protein
MTRKANGTLQAQPFTAMLPDSEIQRWLTWAEWMVRQFHRSSSAVEGRNGCLLPVNYICLTIATG